MSVWSMYMAMFKFFCRGVTNIHNDDLKVEYHAGQRVVAIDNDGVICDALDGDRDGLAIRALGIELHAGFNFLLRREHAAGNIL